MRCEEIQIAGALLENPQWAARSCMLLPGTRAKWAHVVRYRTYLTGELFAVLRAPSILGRLMPAPADGQETDESAFELGLSTARRSQPGDFPHQIFAARTLGLAGRLAPPALADYLSGLLIGHELVSGLAGIQESAEIPLIMIGEPALCRRYTRSLAYFGRTASAVLGNTAPVGLWNFADAAGVLSESV